MANYCPGTLVHFVPGVADKLRFPPAITGSRTGVAIAVHPGALRAPASLHTQIVAFDGQDIVWAGALDEKLLAVAEGSCPSPRKRLADRLLQGKALWSVIRPGSLLRPGAQLPGSTIYGGLSPATEKFRPWLVIGELSNGQVLAAPLNDRSADFKRIPWFTPLLRQRDLWPDSPKDSTVELAHVWSLPATDAFRTLVPSGRGIVEQVIRRYY